MDLARPLLPVKHIHPMPEDTAMLTSATMSLNPLFLRHDLMIELGRLEMAMQDMRGTDTCLLYTSDAADERSSVDLGGRRIIKKKKKIQHMTCATAIL